MSDDHKRFPMLRFEFDLGTVGLIRTLDENHADLTQMVKEGMAKALPKLREEVDRVCEAAVAAAIARAIRDSAEQAVEELEDEIVKKLEEAIRKAVRKARP